MWVKVSIGGQGKEFTGRRKEEEDTEDNRCVEGRRHGNKLGVKVRSISRLSLWVKEKEQDPPIYNKTLLLLPFV